ncbi:hypothetical protein [Acanthopleuribacter pedis]|uniref:Uncharacterized protein n=1 Tax=Acanthopleuribacter pedis TaxID=442870 RepID=A0A8J7Q1W4_9BACT|nr:hypothetical protein [Acanthopleuribacter pedis]MBO1317745.1 hypothetical protein [Acanthopleuribacter pedis]
MSPKTKLFLGAADRVVTTLLVVTVKTNQVLAETAYECLGAVPDTRGTQVHEPGAGSQEKIERALGDLKSRFRV